MNILEKIKKLESKEVFKWFETISKLQENRA